MRSFWLFWKSNKTPIREKRVCGANKADPAIIDTIFNRSVLLDGVSILYFIEDLPYFQSTRIKIKKGRYSNMSKTVNMTEELEISNSTIDGMDLKDYRRSKNQMDLS